jgi:hypothetical protein
MQSAIQILEFCSLAFVTLSVTLVLLNIFWDSIGQELVLHSIGKEAVIAGFVSVIEGTGFWLILWFIPQGGLALFIPALIVGIVYKLTHLEDWSRYEIFCLLMFQLVISASGANLILGHFKTATIILFVFATVLAFTVSMLRGL